MFKFPKIPYKIKKFKHDSDLYGLLEFSTVNIFKANVQRFDGCPVNKKTCLKRPQRNQNLVGRYCKINSAFLVLPFFICDSIFMSLLSLDNYTRLLTDVISQGFIVSFIESWNIFSRSCYCLFSDVPVSFEVFISHALYSRKICSIFVVMRYNS